MPRFKGYELYGNVQDFRKHLDLLKQEFEGGLSVYTDRHTPRKEVENRIYTSSEYPCSEEIVFHSENSKDEKCPNFIAFYCVKAADVGGETILVDNELLYKELSDSTVKIFERNGLEYVRNFTPGLGVSWQQAYGVEDMGELEEYCQNNNLIVNFRNGSVQTVKKGIVSFERENARYWFNQAHLFHPSSLRTEIRERMQCFLPEELFPSYVRFGNGDPIDDQLINEIMAVADDISIEIKLREKEVLVINNIQISHGRKPYTGDRSILVALSQRSTELIRFGEILDSV